MTEREVSTRTELPATLPLLVVAYAAVARSQGRTDGTARPVDRAALPPQLGAGHPEAGA